MVLHNLPRAMRNVFELFTNEQLHIEEIAEVRESTMAEVEHLLNEAKRALQVSFLNRYAIP